MNQSTIESYEFGKVVINGKTFNKDLIITPTKVLPNWRRTKGHSICIADLSEVLKKPPKTLIIGTGAFGRVDVSDKILSELTSKGIHIIVQKTGEACQTFNKRSKDEEVVAALHLTC